MSQRGFTFRDATRYFVIAIARNISYRGFSRKEFPIKISFKEMAPLVEVSYQRYMHYKFNYRTIAEKTPRHEWNRLKREFEGLYPTAKRQKDVWKIAQSGSVDQIFEVVRDEEDKALQGILIGAYRPAYERQFNMINERIRKGDIETDVARVHSELEELRARVKGQMARFRIFKSGSSKESFEHPLEFALD